MGTLQPEAPEPRMVWKELPKMHGYVLGGGAGPQRPRWIDPGVFQSLAGPADPAASPRGR